MEKLIVLALACGTALSSIQILHPKDLKVSIKNDGFVKASLGNFGHIIYGTSVVSYLSYMNRYISLVVSTTH